MEPLQDRERVEFVPWDQLRKPPPMRPTNRTMLVGVAVVVASLSLGYALFRSGPSPDVEAPFPIATAAAQSIDELEADEALPSGLGSDLGYSEADLRAGDSSVDMAWVEGTATGFVRDYFSTTEPAIHPYVTGEVPAYVDWVSVIGLEGTESDGPWQVTVRVGLVELGPQPRRLPASDYTVMVDRRELGEVSFSVPVLGGQPSSATAEGHDLEEVPESVQAMLDPSVEGMIVGGWRQLDTWYVVVQQPTGPPVVIEVAG